jgi:hypothetical protein
MAGKRDRVGGCVEAFDGVCEAGQARVTYLVKWESWVTRNGEVVV